MTFFWLAVAFAATVVSVWRREWWVWVPALALVVAAAFFSHMTNWQAVGLIVLAVPAGLLVKTARRTPVEVA